MKIEFQKYIVIVKIEGMITYIYTARSIKDLWKIWNKYKNKIYEIQTIDLKPQYAEKKDRTIYEIYNYHEDKDI